MQIHVNKNGQQIGPYDLEQVNQYLEQGSLLPTDPAWHEGLAGWVPLNQVEGVVVPGASAPPPFDPGAFSASPPPPAAPSTPSPEPTPSPVAPKTTKKDDSSESLPESWPAPAEPTQPLPAGPPVAMGTICPQCNVVVQPGQVVCMNCGSHLHAIPTAGKKGAGKLIAIIGGSVLVLALLGGGLFLILNKAKNKANRVKCANNLASIHKAYSSYAAESDGATAHLDPRYAPDPNADLQARAMGYSSVDDPCDITRWMSAYPIRQSLVTPRSLVSPLDPEAMAAMQRSGEEDFSEFGKKPVQLSSDSQSYALAMQGDLLASETVLVITRNLKNASDAQRRAWYQAKGGRNSGDIWYYPYGPRPWSKHIGAAHIQDGGMFGYAAEFHGEDGDEDPKHMMEGMHAGEANWGMAGGSVAQGSNTEFNDQLRRARDHFREGHASAPGLNLTVLRPQQ